MENIAENAKFMLDYSAPPVDADWAEMEYGELKTRELRFRSLARHAKESITKDSNVVDYNAEEEDACLAAQLIAESISWDEDGEESWSVTVWTAQGDDGCWYYKYTDSAPVDGDPVRFLYCYRGGS
jgi:hypothetical protein